MNDIPKTLVFHLYIEVWGGECSDRVEKQIRNAKKKTPSLSLTHTHTHTCKHAHMHSVRFSLCVCLQFTIQFPYWVSDTLDMELADIRHIDDIELVSQTQTNKQTHQHTHTHTMDEEKKF